MNPIFWFRREKRDLKSQRGGEGGGVPGVQNCIHHFCPQLPSNGPPWSSLIIGDSLSLNGSPGLWREKMQKSVRCGFCSLQKLWSAARCGRDGGRPLQNIKKFKYLRFT